MKRIELRDYSNNMWIREITLNEYPVVGEYFVIEDEKYLVNQRVWTKDGRGNFLALSVTPIYDGKGFFPKKKKPYTPIYGSITLEQADRIIELIREV